MPTRKHALILCAIVLIGLTFPHDNVCSQRVSHCSDSNDESYALAVGVIGVGLVFFARYVGIPSLHGYTLKNALRTSYAHIEAHLQNRDASEQCDNEKNLDTIHTLKEDLDEYVNAKMGYGRYLTGIKGIQETTEAQKELALLEQCLEESVKKHRYLTAADARICFKKTKVHKE